MSKGARVHILAIGAPVAAVVSALFLLGCVALARLLPASSAAGKVELLLAAGLVAFAVGEAVALVLGVAGTLMVLSREEVMGLPEALLGIISVGLFVVTVLCFLVSAAAPPAP
jgi:hypothetical protein